MKIKLKQFRVKAGLTQAKIAEAVGVSQPNYQRWEAGSAPIPEDKMKKLSKVLRTSSEALVGRHSPIEAGFYDDSVGENLNYYGEVSVQFCGDGAPLLLSISEGAFHHLHRDLQRDVSFVTVESLTNQTVAIRTKAISDLYFSSEAYDYCGPEEKVFQDYPDHIAIQMPDARDWEIVEALASDVFATALRATYQLSSGQKRSVNVDDPEDLFRAFYPLTDFDGGDPAEEMILLPAEGWHRTIFINKNALDYIVIPTHRYDEGRTEIDAQDLDILDTPGRSERGKAKSKGGK